MAKRTPPIAHLGVLSVAGLVALTACSGDSDGGSDGDTITIGIAGEEPYSYLNDSGEPEGATVALAEEIFGEMGYEVEAELDSWDNLIPSVNADRYDAVSAGMSITPDRCEEAEFAEPEIMYTTALLVEEGNPLGVENFDDVLEMQEDGEDITLAILTSGVEAEYASEMDLEYEGVSSADDGVEMVENGRADAFGVTAISLNEMAGDIDGLEVTEPFVQEIDGIMQYGAGSTVFSADNDELLEEYNEHLAEMKSNGELEEILTDYGFTEAEVPPEDMTTEQLCEGDLESLQDIDN